MNVNSSQLEEFLEWQLNACDEKAAELRRALRQNLDRHERQSKYLEREVAEKRMRRSQADDQRHVAAWNAARRAFQMVLKAIIINALLEPLRINYRNKRDGTAVEVPEVKVEKLSRDVIRVQEDKLREICSSL
jgi:hypothetical protein